MDAMLKKFKFTPAFCFQAAALLFVLIAIILYGATGKNAFTPELSGGIVAVSVIVLILQAAEAVLCCLVKKEDIKHVLVLCQYVLAILIFLAFALYIAYNVNYLASVLASIDGTKIAASFVVTAIFFVLACAMAITAAVLFGRSVVAGGNGGTEDDQK